MWGFIWDPNCLTFRLYISKKKMGGNNEFFENFERNKYLKKLHSMQRVKAVWNMEHFLLRNQFLIFLNVFKTIPNWDFFYFGKSHFFHLNIENNYNDLHTALDNAGQQIRSKIDSFQNANVLISQPNPRMIPLIGIVSERRFLWGSHHRVWLRNEKVIMKTILFTIS